MRAVLAVALGLVACGRGQTPFRVAAADPATVRRLPAGEVVGGRGRYGSLAWLGIPYARPPVGELRWRAPEPLPPWRGRRDALAFGAACVQYGSRFGGAPGVRPGAIGGDEDCLTLNVWTPDDVAAGERLPVFLWIHGGGNTIGHAGFYDGGHLASAERLVVVTVQYRIGPFGWFRHPALRAGAKDAREASGSFALLDQVRALGWVRDNVAGFGGDPGNVTIAGESAGALNVYALLLAPPARGLFHRAVIESGGLWFDEAMAPAAAAQAPAEIAVRLMTRDDPTHDRAAAERRLAAMAPADVAAWLRARPAHDVLAAYEPMPSGMIQMPLAVEDGAVVPEGAALAALRRADGWNRVPVLVGTNRDENKLFMFAEPELIQRRMWILPRFVDENGYVTSAEYLARVWKAAGADGPASAMEAAEPRVFVYRFDWRDEPTVLGADLSKMLGAAHAFEIPFVFGHFDLGSEGNVIFTRQNEPGRLELSHAMMSYWGEFARHGTPGRGGHGDQPAWEPWGDGRTLVLDAPAGGGVRMVSGVETRERVLADLAKDPRLPRDVDRCRMLRALAEWAHGLTRAEYAARAECAAFPYDGFPWRDRG